MNPIQSKYSLPQDSRNFDPIEVGFDIRDTGASSTRLKEHNKTTRNYIDYTREKKIKKESDILK